MASQPTVEASTTEDQPASLQTVLSTLQTLTASLGQLANTGQQTQNSVAHLESSVTLTANACNALADKVSALQTQVDAGVASSKKDAPVDPEDLLPYAPHFSARNENPHHERPRGVTDKPQLYALSAHPVYDHLTL